ncbi:MAG TPA: tetratricopeptide repeat protein [Oculatellaceae cyanobacterium]
MATEIPHMLIQRFPRATYYLLLAGRIAVSVCVTACLSGQSVLAADSPAKTTTQSDATSAGDSSKSTQQGSLSVTEKQPESKSAPAASSSAQNPQSAAAVSAKGSSTNSSRESETSNRDSTDTRSSQLLKIQSSFEDGNFKQARKLANEYVANHPLDHNGYFALGQIDIQEKQLAPELDQWAIIQFLKAEYLSPNNKKLQNIWGYLNFPTHNDLAHKQGILPINHGRDGPDSLLNLGVNLFRIGNEHDAIDIFTFMTKCVPLGAASAHYNLGAINECHGRLEAARKEYLASMRAAQYRTTLLNGLEAMKQRLQSFDRPSASSAMANRRRAGRAVINEIGQSTDSGASNRLYARSTSADAISERLIARTLQRIDLKIHSRDKGWTGYVPQKDARPTERCIINRLGPDDQSDIADAGDSGIRPRR